MVLLSEILKPPVNHPLINILPEIQYEKNVQIKEGATLQVTCTVTNAQSDLSSSVNWSNNGATLASADDVTITPTYTSGSKTFTSTLQITNYDETDQVYTCSVAMAGTTTDVSKNVWQFVYFQTNQAVEVGEASTTLSCKVSGAANQPTKWTWIPAKTSVYFEQAETAWNADEGSQESHITIYNVQETMDFVCKAVISGVTYKKDVTANAYSKYFTHYHGSSSLTHPFLRNGGGR